MRGNLSDIERTLIEDRIALALVLTDYMRLHEIEEDLKHLGVTEDDRLMIEVKNCLNLIDQRDRVVQ